MYNYYLNERNLKSRQNENEKFLKEQMLDKKRKSIE